MGDAPGLPAGPGLPLWALDLEGGSAFVRWVDPDVQYFDFWRSRWRDPDVSTLWTLSVDDAAATVEGASQETPIPPVAGHQLDCEVAFCDVGGNLMSGWSAFKSLFP